MLSVCVSYMKSLSVSDICNDSCFVLTSNHLYVSICYGYRRLDLKGGSPAGGILDSSCLYANILEWKVGSFCHSRFLTFWCRCQNSKAGWRSWHLCVQGLRILVYKQHSLSSWSGIYFILVVCHFLKYLSEYISLLVTFSTPPHLHPRSVKVEEKFIMSSVSFGCCIFIVYMICLLQRFCNYSRSVGLWQIYTHCFMYESMVSLIYIFSFHHMFT